jgi:hypothetical protein
MSEISQEGPHFQPRCKACKHPDRAEIDLLLATHHSFVSIERGFGLPYRTLANHLRRHLDLDDPTIRGAVQKELAIVRRNHEIGVEAAIERRLMLDFCIRVYYECLMRSS